MSRRLRLVCLLPALALLSPLAAAAQQPGFTIEGRVLDESTGLGVSAAGVELAGHGYTITDPDGSFRFEAVRPGGYALLVVAYGYASRSRDLSIRDDLTFTIELEPAPVRLEGVGATFVEIEGRVRDRANDFFMVDAIVLTNQGRGVATDAHGRFALEGMLEGAPLRLTIESFGYATLDTVVVPREDEKYLFDLEIDPVVEAQIAVQIERLERRAAPAFAVGRRNLNRDDLLAYAGNHTVQSMLLFEYGPRRGSRVPTVYVDGMRWSLTNNPVDELFALLPETLERIEFIVIPYVCARVDIYTRDFMRELIAREGELPPVCDGIRNDPWKNPSRVQFEGFR
jgi:hypothetical protein